MNVFEYVYAYVTVEGRKGTVRADSKQEAKDKVSDYYKQFLGIDDEVKWIVELSTCETDYGVVTDECIDKALKDCMQVRQYSFDVYGEFESYELENIIKNAIENAFNAEMFGFEWKATWKFSDYVASKPPIASD